MENANPNAAAAPRRMNPFKAEDRIAFPPVDEALACRSVAGALQQGVDGAESSAPCLDLTIGMQSTIHPHSFCDDVAASAADASHDCSSGDDDSAVPLHWGRDLLSPEPQGSRCRHVAVRPAHRSPDAGVRGTPRGQSASGVDGSENNTLTNSPCMADIFMALQVQGLREVPDDGVSVGGEDAAGNGTHRSAASSKKASWGGSQDLDLQESDQELSRSSFASAHSSGFAKDVDGISHAAGTLNHSSHIQCSHIKCGSEGGHSFVHAGGLADEVSFGTPVRQAQSCKEGTHGAPAQGACKDSELSGDESAVGADRSLLSVLPEPNPAGPGLRTPNPAARKPVFSPATPITPASCFKKRGGEEADKTAARVRFCQGFDDKLSPIGAAHRTPNRPSPVLQHGQVAMNLSHMLSSARDGGGGRRKDDAGAGTAGLSNAGTLAQEGDGDAVVNVSGNITHNTSSSNSSSSSHGSRRSLLSHPAFAAWPSEDRSQHALPSRARPRPAESSVCGGKSMHEDGNVLDLSGVGGEVEVEGAPAMVRFASECLWGTRGDDSLCSSSMLAGAAPSCGASSSGSASRYSASIALSLRADGSFSLSTELAVLSPDACAARRVLAATASLGSYTVTLEPDGSMRCSLNGLSSASHTGSRPAHRDARPGSEYQRHADEATTVGVEGTLYGNAAREGVAGTDTGDASLGGLYLHSLDWGFGGAGMFERVPDAVKRRLVDLRRIWGSIQHQPLERGADASRQSSGGAAHSSRTSAPAACRGAVVQCSVCRSAVACDSSNVLAWLHDAPPRSQTSLEAKRSPAHSKARGAANANPTARGADSIELLRSQESRSELRDSLSPAGKKFHDNLLFSLLSRATGGKHGGRAGGDVTIEEAAATLRRLARGGATFGSASASRRVSWPMDDSSWESSFEPSSLFAGRGDSYTETSRWRRGRGGPGRGAYSEAHDPGSGAVDEESSLGDESYWGGGAAQERGGWRGRAHETLSSGVPRAHVRSYSTGGNVQRSSSAESMHTASGAALASMRAASRRIFSVAAGASYRGKHDMRDYQADLRRHVSRHRVASPSSRDTPSAGFAALSPSARGARHAHAGAASTRGFAGRGYLAWSV